MQIKYEDLETLHFKDPSDNHTVKKLKDVEGGLTLINEITSLKNCMAHLTCSRNKIHKLDWAAIDNDKDISFVVSPNNTILPGMAQMTPSTNPTNTSIHNGQGQHIPPTESNLFKKIICCDTTLFPKLEQDDLHNKWTKHTQIIVAS